jgi:Ca2+/Na+ antiporter
MYVGNIGFVIVLSCILFLYGPFITTLVLRKAMITDKTSKKAKRSFYILCPIIVLFLSALLFNIYQYQSPLDGYLLFCLLLTVLYIYIRIKERKQKNYIP